MQGDKYDNLKKQYQLAFSTHFSVIMTTITTGFPADEFLNYLKWKGALPNTFPFWFFSRTGSYTRYSYKNSNLLF